jgi:hypothetical protein
MPVKWLLRENLSLSFANQRDVQFGGDEAILNMAPLSLDPVNPEYQLPCHGLGL